MNNSMFPFICFVFPDYLQKEVFFVCTKLKKFSISSKVFFSLASLIVIIPLIFLIVFFDFYTVHVMNGEVASANKNMLSLYYQKLDSDLSQIELSIAQDWVQNWDYQKLQYSLDPIEVHTDTLSIMNQNKELLSIYDCIGSIHIYSRPNDICRGAYSKSYSYDIKESMQEYVKNLAYKHISASWYTDNIAGKNYLIRVLGLEEAYSVCMIDFDLIVYPSSEYDLQSDSGSLVYISENGILMNNEEFLNKARLSLSPADDSVIKNGRNENYFVVGQPLHYGNLSMLYISPYQGSFYYMDTAQRVALFFSIFALLLIPCTYYTAIRLYFVPLEAAIDTMKKIRSGNIDLKLSPNSYIREFAAFNTTFNSMMDEIKVLKIHTYEHLLDKQKAELQYMQLQLNPHFYLNCLKTLFGMIQHSKNEKAQQMILHFSEYIRYTFRNNSALITLDTELNQVNNYYKILQTSTAKPAKLIISSPDELKKCMVPLLCIQTFVENSFKYAVVPDRELTIQISVHSLITEDGSYLNIDIQDNGPGFSSEIVNLLNNAANTASDSGRHIGIYNLRHRLELLYGNRAGFICMNNPLGALVEILLPFSPENKPEDSTTEVNENERINY